MSTAWLGASKEERSHQTDARDGMVTIEKGTWTVNAPNRKRKQQKIRAAAMAVQKSDDGRRQELTEFTVRPDPEARPNSRDTYTPAASSGLSLLLTGDGGRSRPMRAFSLPIVNNTWLIETTHSHVYRPSRLWLLLWQSQLHLRSTVCDNHDRGRLGMRKIPFATGGRSLLSRICPVLGGRLTRAKKMPCQWL